MTRDTLFRLALLGCIPLGCPQLQGNDLTIVSSDDSLADAGEGAGASAIPPTKAGERGDAGSSSLGGGSPAGASSGGAPSTAGSPLTAGMAGAEGEACGSPNVPVASAACPATCARCEAGFCIVECHGQDACKEGELSCPSGLGCRLECEGKSACAKANLICPDAFDCLLSCAGDDACKDARLRCAGNCAVDCTAGAKACDHLDVTCGVGQCQASCQADSIAPELNCGSACSCQQCP